MNQCFFFLLQTYTDTPTRWTVVEIPSACWWKNSFQEKFIDCDHNTEGQSRRIFNMSTKASQSEERCSKKSSDYKCVTQSLNLTATFLWILWEMKIRIYSLFLTILLSYQVLETSIHWVSLTTKRTDCCGSTFRVPLFSSDKIPLLFPDFSSIFFIFPRLSLNIFIAFIQYLYFNIWPPLTMWKLY